MTEKNIKLELIKMSDVPLEEIDWLWYPYIAYGKITIMHGNPGDGKTNIALKIASQCSTGETLPGQINMDPITVIYQTAEDGLGDTIKPRLIDAGADQERIFTISEEKEFLDLSDSRIEEAIVATGAKLLIIDPLQAYLGDIDMNNCIAVRNKLKRVVKLAQDYKIAVILIGHLNKAQGQNSIYRTIGSADFAAVVRSILVVGRHKDNPSIRVIVQDKNNAAPEGESIGFRLDGAKKFEWVDGYGDTTTDDILYTTRSKGRKNTKLDQALAFLNNLFSKNKRLNSAEVYKLANEAGFHNRTLDEAKKYIPNLHSVKSGKNWEWYLEEPEDLDLPFEIIDDDELGGKENTVPEEGSKYAKVYSEM